MRSWHLLETHMLHLVWYILWLHNHQLPRQPTGMILNINNKPELIQMNKIAYEYQLTTLHNFYSFYRRMGGSPIPSTSIAPTMSDSTSPSPLSQCHLRLSGHTIDKATKAKVTLENYYSNLITQHMERKNRWIQDYKIMVILEFQIRAGRNNTSNIVSYI